MDDSTAALTRPPSGHAEMLIEVRLPARRHGSSAYLKVDRRAGDWAVVAAGAAIWLEDGLISDARVGLAAVGPNTTRIPEVSAALRGRAPDEEAFAEAGRLAAAGCSPVTDAAAPRPTSATSPTS